MTGTEMVHLKQDNNTNIS